jgi:hypothetical protein
MNAPTTARKSSNGAARLLHLLSTSRCCRNSILAWLVGAYMRVIMTSILPGSCDGYHNFSLFLVRLLAALLSLRGVNRKDLRLA